MAADARRADDLVPRAIGLDGPELEENREAGVVHARRVDESRADEYAVVAVLVRVADQRDGLAEVVPELLTGRFEQGRAVET